MRFSTRQKIIAFFHTIAVHYQDLWEDFKEPDAFRSRKACWRKFKNLIKANLPHLKPPRIPSAEEQLRLEHPGAWGANQYPFLEPLVDAELGERWHQRCEAFKRLCELTIEAIKLTNQQQSETFQEIITMERFGTDISKRMRVWFREVSGFKGFGELSQKITAAQARFKSKEAAWEELNNLARIFGFIDKALERGADLPSGDTGHYDDEDDED